MVSFEVPGPTFLFMVDSVLRRPLSVWPKRGLLINQLYKDLKNSRSSRRKCCLPTLWEKLICPVWVRCSFWTNPWGQKMECSQWSGWVLCPPTVPGGDGQEWCHANSAECSRTTNCRRCWMVKSHPATPWQHLEFCHSTGAEGLPTTVHTRNPTRAGGDRRRRLPVSSLVYVLTSRVHQRSGQSTKQEWSRSWCFDPAQIPSAH